MHVQNYPVDTSCIGAKKLTCALEKKKTDVCIVKQMTFALVEKTDVCIGRKKLTFVLVKKNWLALVQKNWHLHWWKNWQFLPSTWPLTTNLLSGFVCPYTCASCCGVAWIMTPDALWSTAREDANEYPRSGQHHGIPGHWPGWLCGFNVSTESEHIMHGVIPAGISVHEAWLDQVQCPFLNFVLEDFCGSILWQCKLQEVPQFAL